METRVVSLFVLEDNGMWTQPVLLVPSGASGAQIERCASRRYNGFITCGLQEDLDAPEDSIKDCTGDPEFQDMPPSVSPFVPPTRIVRWIRTGELSEDELPESVETLLEQAGRRLDRACAPDILGTCVFQTADGRTLVGTVEFEVRPVNPDYLADLLLEDDQEGYAEEIGDPLDMLECRTCGELVHAVDLREHLMGHNPSAEVWLWQDVRDCYGRP
jgi:hypothetical protein